MVIFQNCVPTGCVTCRCVPVSAENIAKEWCISRQQQDDFALDSQMKCEAAQKEGAFDDEIVPVTVKSRKGRALCGHHTPSEYSSEYKNAPQI